MKKKLVTLFVAVFAISSLAACGGKDKESTASTQETAATVETAATETSEVETTVPETAGTETEEAVHGEEKTIVVSVVDDQGETTVFEIETEAEVLIDAIQNIDGLTIEGTEESWGFYVTTVNGLEANYDENQSYWALYENQEMALYGVSELEIVDGNEYSFVYTVDESVEE